AKAHETETGQRPRLSRGGSRARHRQGLHGHLPGCGRPACVPWPNFDDGMISYIRKVLGKNCVEIRPLEEFR
ncbi:hypothetical protein PIB30_112802, partial [Stylosanthes scabra]|nr:hypothetical protein [Stylosanthes scabra]